MQLRIKCEKLHIIKSMDKFINCFIFEEKKFMDVVAHLYGLMDLIQYNIKSVKLLYDFEYYTFIKKTKTLIRIRNILNITNMASVALIIP